MSAPGIPVQSWFSQFVGFVEAEAQAAEAKIVEVADEIGPVVVEYSEEFLSSLAQIAIGAVLQQAPLVISGAEKFGGAVTTVIQSVETQGKTIALNDAHAITQAAYNAVQQVATPAAS
jgi:hypothetical protein